MERGFFALNLCFIILYHSLLTALNLAISSKKSLAGDQKKASLSAMVSTSCPLLIISSIVSIPFATATAISVTPEVPNSRKLYPFSVIKFHCGTFFLINSILSHWIRKQSLGGTYSGPLRINSSRVTSFCTLPRSLSQGMPRSSARTKNMGNNIAVLDG